MTSNKISGPNISKKKFLHNQLQIMKHDLGDALPHIKKDRKKTVRPTGLKYNRVEDKFRTALIKYLRDNKCRVFRIEPATRGKFGVGDLLVFSYKTKWGGFVECKSKTGIFSEDQILFEKLCKMSGINYLVASSFDDVSPILK